MITFSRKARIVFVRPNRKFERDNNALHYRPSTLALGFPTIQLMPKQDSKHAAAFVAPEAIAGLLSALGIPIAAAIGNILLAGLLAAITFGIFLRFKRKKIQSALRGKNSKQ
jgi:hypothetical protein